MFLSRSCHFEGTGMVHRYPELTEAFKRMHLAEILLGAVFSLLISPSHRPHRIRGSLSCGGVWHCPPKLPNKIFLSWSSFNPTKLLYIWLVANCAHSNVPQFESHAGVGQHLHSATRQMSVFAIGTASLFSRMYILMYFRKHIHTLSPIPNKGLALLVCQGGHIMLLLLCNTHPHANGFAAFCKHAKRLERRSFCQGIWKCLWKVSWHQTEIQVEILGIQTRMKFYYNHWFFLVTNRFRIEVLVFFF